MSFFPSRLAWLPLAGMLVVTAGCGGSSSSSNSNATATAQSAAAVPTGQAVPTQGVPPTAVITGGDTAAIVDGKKVPMSSYRLLFNFTQREYAGSAGVTPAAIASRTMEQVIAEAIAQQYADSHGIKVTSPELDRVVQAQQQRSGGAQAFQTTLARFGLTTDTFKQLVEPSLVEQKVAQKIAPIKPSLQPVARVRHILIGTTLQPGKRLRSDAAAKAKAEKVLNELKHGANFATLVQQNSDDTGKVQNGGYYTVHPTDQLVPQFLHASFALPVNQISIVKTQYGYHVFEVVSRHKVRTILPAQQQQQQQQFGTWVRKQETHSSIKRIAKLQGAK